MKSLFFLSSLFYVPAFASSQFPAVAFNVTTLDQDYSFELKDKNNPFQNDFTVKLKIKNESVQSIVASISEQSDAVCKIESVKNVGKDVELAVSFEALLEDGFNRCVIEVSNFSFNSDIEIFRYISDDL
jgi:hypothetical protein